MSPARTAATFAFLPLRVTKLVGAARPFVLTGGLDALRDEDEAYGARLEAAGVPTLVRRHEGLPHGFIAPDRLSAMARRANSNLVASEESYSTS